MKLSTLIRGVSVLFMFVITSCSGSTTNEGSALQTSIVGTQQALTLAPPATEAPNLEPPTSEAAATSLPAETSAPLDSVAPDISFEGISLQLDGQLARGTTNSITPAATPAGDNPLLSPAYDQLDFQGFVVPSPQNGPVWRLPRLYVIAVTDMQSFSDVGYGLPELTQLKQILADKPAAISEDMPVLPYSINFNYAEAFHARVQYISFANGSGVRFLAEYMQGISTVGKRTSYMFQGLTADGKYFVSLTLPIGRYTALDQLNFPFVDVDTNNGTWDVLSHDYDSYLASAASILETTPDNSFTPDLGRLDALVQSLNVKP